jgi:hypothetical protein
MIFYLTNENMHIIITAEIEHMFKIKGKNNEPIWQKKKTQKSR